MRNMIALLATLTIGYSTSVSAQEFPGCTPKSDTPSVVLEYFQKYNKPIPVGYCVTDNEDIPPLPEEKVPDETNQGQAEEEAPPPETTQEETPPDEDYNQWEPEQHPLPPPFVGNRPGGVVLDFPGFHLEFQFRHRRHRNDW